MSGTSKSAFNSTVSENGFVDFDSILSDLCHLEHQLSEDSAFNDATPVHDTSLPPLPARQPADNGVVFKDYSNLKSPSPRKVPHGKLKLQKSDETLTTVDTDLDFALSELSALVGSSLDFEDCKEPWSGPDRRPNCSLSSDLANTYKNNLVQSNQMTRESNSANNNLHARSSSVENGAPTRKGSSTAALNSGGLFQGTCHDHLSDGGQNDSAFDDNISLPSSGSRVSMATSSRSSGSSITNCVLGSSNDVDEGQRAGGVSKVTLEKNNHVNQNKICVRVYSPEGGSDSIMVTERMTVSQVVDGLLSRNHVEPTLSWSLVEQIPNLLMERMLEDDERLMDYVMIWTKDSENRLVLVERPDKYDVFVYPEKYLAAMEDKNRKCDETVRQVLIQEFLDSNCRLPEFDGTLYIKLEGRKAWKKLCFILRASGIYYNPKGKSKALIDLVCLQKLDLVEVYTAIGWKKKYKAPTDFGFALKHPQIQKKTPKYIKYFCAEDMASMWHWINAIRLAKYGQQLHSNFLQRQSSVHRYHGDDSFSRSRQTALIQEKICEMFSQQLESVPSFSCAVEQSPSSQLQTFRAESPDGGLSTRLLKSCLETNGTNAGSPAKSNPQIPITTEITKQLSGQTMVRSPVKIAPKSPKKFMKTATSAHQLPPPTLVSSNSMESWKMPGFPQQPDHEILFGSVDQLQNVGSPAFNSFTNQKTLKMAPSGNTAKWETSNKHAVIKRTASIGHRDIGEPPVVYPPIGVVSAKPLPLPKPQFSPTKTAAASGALPSPGSLPPIRRKFPSTSSFSDCNDRKALLLPQVSPKPKPPLPPKRKDIMKQQQSVSVEGSPTKGYIATVTQNLTLPRKSALEGRPSSASSQQSLSASNCTSPGGSGGGLSMKRSPSCESWQNSDFLMDLQRVILEKQARGVIGTTDVVPAQPRNVSDVDLESLPPPPAALLDGLKNQKVNLRPPPPKRSQETQLTYK